MEEHRKFKRPESVLVLIYTSTGYVLVLRRVFPDDFWQSVTGSLEWGEDALHAAARELFEETGLDATGLVDCGYSQEFEIYSLWRDRYAPGITRNTEHVFALMLDDCVPIRMDKREHLEYEWVSREEAIERVTSYTNSEALVRWVPEELSKQE